MTEQTRRAIALASVMFDLRTLSAERMLYLQELGGRIGRDNAPSWPRRMPRPMVERLVALYQEGYERQQARTGHPEPATPTDCD